MKAKIWRYANDGMFSYPETEISYEQPSSRKTAKFGIAISGGGTRSATAGFGQLRGLRDIKLDDGGQLLERATYLSCNSGGTWVCAPYVFNRKEDVGDNEFFFPYTPPAEITLQNLENIPKKSYLYRVTQAGVLLRGLPAYSKFGDEGFSHVLGRMFLNSYESAFQYKAMGYSEQSVAGVIARNGDKLKTSDFVTVVKDRPFLIANGTLHNWKNGVRNRQGMEQIGKPGAAFHIEMTPLYTGVKIHHPGKGRNGLDIGGGYIESFAYDSSLLRLTHDEGGAIAEVKLAEENGVSGFFSVADMMAISGAAPSQVDERLQKMRGYWWIKLASLFSLTTWMISLLSRLLKMLPEMNHWSIGSALSGSGNSRNTAEYNMGDGGPLDDIALIPLLGRGVKKIIAFVNSPYPLEKEPGKSGGDPDVAQYFGVRVDGKAIEDDKMRKAYQVFDNTGDKYKQLMQALISKKNGAPGMPVYKGIYTLIDNDFYGIQGGEEIEVLWFYLDRSKAWEEKLTPEIQMLIQRDAAPYSDDDSLAEGRYGHFPNYLTFFENFPTFINLNADQASLLANYTTWVVKENEQVIADFLGVTLGKDSPSR